MTPGATATITYADIADLADSATLVIRARPGKVVRVEPERAQGVRAGWARLYVEAKTEALISGASAIGQALRYVVDVPLDARGKVPQFKKRSVILFAQPVPGRPMDIQLVAPDAQLLWDAALEQRVREVASALISADAPPRITGVREAMHVPGNLAGEGETQIFLTTARGAPASITVVRRPGAEPVWGVSFSEIVDQAVRAPARDTLAWYRLACFLPSRLPDGASLSERPEDTAAAVGDYALVREHLGKCPRSRS